jgi:glycosyltransferase involved in cell wall biosynthesis
MPEVGIVERLRFLAFEAREVARQFDADLYYSASELSPVACPCPKIAAFRNPNLFTPMRLGWPPSQRLRLFALRSFSRYSARTSSRILFVSHDSARWIGDVLGIPNGKRAAIPHGIDPKLWSKATGPNPIGRKFLLSVSSIYRYKNYVRLIEAWTALAKRWPEVPDLVIVGDDQDPIHSHEMRLARSRASNLAERIHLVGEVPYAEIGRYYKHAEAFVFPSFLETFGHPLLEAMAAGLPVVAADIGVFREIGGDAALYCAPFDTESISRSIEQVLRDDDLRGRLVEKGFERVASYSWDRTVDGMVEMFTEVLEESRR